MPENISRKAIIVLLVLVILVSIIGTWVVLDATSGLSVRPIEQATWWVSRTPKIQEEPHQTTGKVSFGVIEEEENE